jgi:hypothetical protein
MKSVAPMYIYVVVLFIIAHISINTKLASSQNTSPMPLPWYRLLYTNCCPLYSGNDIFILQNLLLRSPHTNSTFNASTKMDFYTAEAVSSFQAHYMNSLVADGLFESKTAQALLSTFSEDNYKDSGFTAASMGSQYKFKLHIPVYRNRSIETIGKLFDAQNNLLTTFHARAHGVRDDGTSAEWPDFGNGDYGATEFYGNGNTVTGLYAVDLNSPEPDPAKYGPFPVIRFVKGLDGNANFSVPNIRNGLLLHTGNWTASESGVPTGWTPLKPMPNSLGCVHVHPSEQKRIVEILISDLGVVVNANPFSAINYPFENQGVAVVELVN